MSRDCLLPAFGGTPDTAPDWCTHCGSENLQHGVCVDCEVRAELAADAEPELIPSRIVAAGVMHLHRIQRIHSAAAETSRKLQVVLLEMFPNHPKLHCPPLSHT